MSLALGRGNYYSANLFLLVTSNAPDHKEIGVSLNPLMEMPTVTMRAHTVAVAAPERTANIHMALTAPMLVKSAGGPPYVGCARNHMHRATAEINKHHQKRY